MVGIRVVPKPIQTRPSHLRDCGPQPNWLALSESRLNWNPLLPDISMKLNSIMMN